jgi:STE24 endopeptidase
VLVAVAVGRPRAVRGGLDRLAARPLLGAAALGAGLSVATTVAALPASAWAHERAVDVGLSTQSFGAWLGDVGKSTAIGAVLTAAGVTLLMALLRRFGRRWWIPGSVAVVLLAVVFAWLAPVLLAPVFNRFEALPDRQPALDRPQRLRRRDRPDQAGRPLRHPDRGHEQGPAQLDRGP